MNKQKFIQNILYAFAAQGTSLLISVVMSFVIPKILGVEEFAYWQLLTY